MPKVAFQEHVDDCLLGHGPLPTQGERSLSDELDDFAAIEAEYRAAAADAYDPISERFRHVSFLSRSKGRGRRRRHWQTVDLYEDAAGAPGRWRTASRMPWDVLATEVYHYDRSGPDPMGLGDRLRYDIETR